METSAITALVGAIALVLGATVTGFWQWATSRGKYRADAEVALTKGETDAQASVMNGFILLLNEFKAERMFLVARIDACEISNSKQDRRIARLERLLVRHNIRIPEDEK